MQDKWFVAFGDDRLKESSRRIRRQAEKIGFPVDHIRVLSEKELDAEFVQRMRHRLVHGSRGFGYWCWKPQIISQVLREMSYGDVLLYADIGCHLHRKGKPRLIEYFELAKKHGVVAFQARSLGEEARNDLSLHFLLEKQWTKMDLLAYYNVSDRKDILESGQVGSGVVVLRKDERSMRIIKEWLQCYYDHFELIDDTPSELANDPMFVENRHDQSVFSLLCKINNVHLLSCGEYVHIRQYMPDGGDKRLWPEYWCRMSQYPIHAKRDLGKYTKMVECPDWLKPILGKCGRRFASYVYEMVKPLIKRIRGLKG